MSTPFSPDRPNVLHLTVLPLLWLGTFFCVGHPTLGASLTLKPVLPIYVQAGARIQLAPVLLNPDSQTVQFTCRYDGTDQLPTTAIFNTTTGAFDYATRPTDFGRHILTVIATSKTESATTDIRIEIDPIVQTSANEIILKDDFSNTPTSPDEPLGPSWQVIRGMANLSASPATEAWLQLHRKDTVVVSASDILLDEFTILFGCSLQWGDAAGVIFLYQDPANYYELSISQGPLKISRIHNGVRTVIGEHDSIDLSMAHSALDWGYYKVHVVRNPDHIVVAVGRFGTSTDFDFAVTDHAPPSSQFLYGKIGFLTPSLSSYVQRWYQIIEAKVFVGKLEHTRKAKTYFVDSSFGDDYADGTELAPFCTIGYASQRALYGDTIIVKPGVYRESITLARMGHADAPITLKAHNLASRPILDGSTIVSGFAPAAFNKVYSAPWGEPIVTAMYQTGKRLALAMQPAGVNPEDPYDKPSNWYEVEAADIAALGSNEETNLLASGTEYLILHDDFRTCNGVQVQDDFWKGAELYHYNNTANVTRVLPVNGYQASANKITFDSTRTLSLRIQPPSNGKSDRYAVANHPGVISRPGQFAHSGGGLFIRPFDDELTMFEAAVLQDGITLHGNHILIDGFEIRRFTRHGIYSTATKTLESFKLSNAFIHHNGSNGLSLQNSKNIVIQDGDICYNNNDGLTFSKGTENLQILRTTIHHNNNNGIWLAGSGARLYGCTQVLIQDCHIHSQGSYRSHPDNLQLQQVDKLTIDNCLFEQDGDQNLWSFLSGDIRIQRSVFINGPLGLCTVNAPTLLNNLFFKSPLRFDGQASVGAGFVTLANIDTAGWEKIRCDIRGDIDSFPLSLVWSGSDIAAQIRNWPADKLLTEKADREAVIARINEVIDTSHFLEDHFYVYPMLSQAGAARLITTALMNRGLIDRNGRFTGTYEADQKEEIQGMNRAILDELYFDGKVSKGRCNYRVHSARIHNNTFLETAIVPPPVALNLAPYFHIDYNYYNIENNWLYNSWRNFAGFGEQSITDRSPLTLANEIIDFDGRNFYLKSTSRLINAGIDVGLTYLGSAPDIGPFEFGSRPSDSRVGHYRFEEYSGNQAKDSSPLKNNALTHDTTWPKGAALTFTLATGAATSGSPASQNITGDLTIAALINPEYEHYGLIGDARIVDKGDSPAGFAFYLKNDGRLAYRAGNDEVVSDAGVIRLNEWQHVAVSHSDKLATVTFYINGQPAGTVTNYQTNPMDSLNSPLIIGNNAALTRGFKGMLTDVRIDSRALTASEIDAIYRTWQVRAHKRLDFDLIATDGDGNPLEFVVQTPPAGATCQDNAFKWLPRHSQAGSYDITFEAVNNPDYTHRVPIVVENVAIDTWYRYWLQCLNKY